MWKLESGSTLWSFLTSTTWKNQEIRNSERADNSKFSQAEKFQPLPQEIAELKTVLHSHKMSSVKENT